MIYFQQIVEFSLILGQLFSDLFGVKTNLHTFSQSTLVTFNDGLLSRDSVLKLLSIYNMNQILQPFSNALANLDLFFILLTIQKLLLHANQVMTHPKLFILNSNQSFIFLLDSIPKL